MKQDTKTTEYIQTVGDYLRPIIDNSLEDYDHKGTITDEIRLEHIFMRLHSEYDHEVARRGVMGALTEWLMGLAIGIDYTYYEIGKLGQAWHKDGLTEKEQEDFEQNWFKHIANHLVRWSEWQQIDIDAISASVHKDKTDRGIKSFLKHN